jgi:capsular polysaccharide biosynthesis protein
MNLMEYVQIVLRRWWIIVLLMILTMGSAFLLSRAQTPVYRATQKILLQPSRIDLGLAEATTRLIRSYVEFLDSNDRAREVIDALQLDMLPGDLRSNVTINTEESRLLITIDVDLPDGNLARDIARQWGEQFILWRDEENQRIRYEDRIRATLLDAVDNTYSQLRPNTTINVLAGAVLGCLLGGVIVFVLEYLESNIIRRREDVVWALEIPVLGSIPSEENPRRS